MKCECRAWSMKMRPWGTSFALGPSKHLRHSAFWTATTIPKLLETISITLWDLIFWNRPVRRSSFYKRKTSWHYKYPNIALLNVPKSVLACLLCDCALTSRFDSQPATWGMWHWEIRSFTTKAYQIRWVHGWTNCLSMKVLQKDSRLNTRLCGALRSSSVWRMLDKSHEK